MGTLHAHSTLGGGDADLSGEDVVEMVVGMPRTSITTPSGYFRAHSLYIFSLSSLNKKIGGGGGGDEMQHFALWGLLF